MFQNPRARKALAAAVLMSAASFSPLWAVAAPAAAASTPAVSASAASAPAASAPASVPLATAQAPAPVAQGNPYGLGALWHNGDLVARSTLLILVIMSMGSWFIMITKFFEQARMYRQARSANKVFWTAGSVEQGAQQLNDASPFRFLVDRGLEATSKHDGLLKDVDFYTWSSMSIQRAQEGVQNRLQDGLAFLATVGSTAPFVGLFGTVWGIINSFHAIALAKNTSLAVVAPGIAEALFTTAFGLIAAIPAVIAYNKFSTDLGRYATRLEGFSGEFQAILSRQLEEEKA